MEAIRRGIDEFKNTSPEEAKKKLEAEAAKLRKTNSELEQQ